MRTCQLISCLISDVLGKCADDYKDETLVENTHVGVEDTCNGHLSSLEAEKSQSADTEHSHHTDGSLKHRMSHLFSGPAMSPQGVTIYCGN